MSKRKNNLDEMQEQKLLKIEHNGVWFAFWGLLVAIIVQSLNGEPNEFQNIAGESIVFICLALYIAIACIKNGIWDRSLQPNLETNISISVVAGMVVGLLYFVSSFLKYHKLLGSIATGIIMLGMIASLSFIALTGCAALYKKRVEKLEENSGSDSDDMN